ncbi:MAG: Bug family tripartite tricarboxylate transporter substrate binding protein [Burkholderiales bacterium]
MKIPAAWIALTCVAPMAYAQALYPTKPIRVIVAYAPGGATDLVARIVAQPMSELLGKTVVIDNRGGAGGTIGMDAVAKAPPDGYTLGFGGTGNLVLAPYLYSKMLYNVQTELAPISDLVISAYVVAVNPTVPARTVGDLVKLAKSNSARLTYGTSGSGSTSHIAAELFRSSTGANIVHVPYKGTGPALAAVVAGENDMMVAEHTPSLQFAKSGRLRLLATTGAKRSSATANLPTLAEAGVKMPVVEGRQGLVAPAGTLATIVARLHDAAVAVLKRADVRSRIDELGFEILGDTPEHFAVDLKNDREAFGKVIRQFGIRAD